MNEEQKSGDVISTSISGNRDLSGSIAIGKGITQTQTVAASAQPAVTESDLATLQRLLDTLKMQVETEALPEKKQAAVEKIEELKEAVTAKEPDLDTMAYIKKWFAKNLPMLAGSVSSLVVHPLVGKLVEAASEELFEDFQRRFGGE